MKALAWIAIPMLLGCGADTFTFVFIEGGSDPVDGAAAPDAGEAEAARPDVETADASDASVAPDVKDAAPDTNACPLSGPAECGSVIDAYCTRYASCCSQFPGSGACSSWGSSTMLCKTHWTGSGFDCGSQKFSPNVCTPSNACKNEIVSASCSAVFQAVNPASANFSSCPTFWSQF